MIDKYILIYPESHEHLGLFADLEHLKNVNLIVARKKNIRNHLLKRLRQIHTSWTINRRVNLPLKKIWYEPLKLDIRNNCEYCIIFVDVAINYIKKDTLRQLCEASNTRCVLVCINAIDAGSIGMLQIKDKIFQIPWNDVYTFDPGDMKKYGFKNVKNSYYSQHEFPQSDIENDVFFVGGLKGGREDFIFHMFEFLENNGVKSNFYISTTREQLLHNLPFKDKIEYFTGGWKPYVEILEQDSKANVIIEIMQGNQQGPSLRYYEAICYNKKLITTNKKAVDLPFFNSDFMKIIERPEDIDIEWVKRRESVDYGYKGEFSPINLLDIVMS